MIERRSSAPLLALVLGLAAPVAAAARDDPADGLRALAALDARVARIAYRLTTGAAPLCGDRAPQSGVVFHAAGQYDARLRSVATRLFGLESGRPVVLAVAPDAPAAAAGLKAGDVVEAIDGSRLEAHFAAPDAGTYQAVAELSRLLDAALARGSATLRVRRPGSVREVRLVPRPGCASLIQLVPSPDPQAGADGRTVTVSTALAERIPSDEELALVLAHELAHNLLHRIEIAGGGRARELAADRLAVALVARAGFDAQAAIGFWSGTGRTLDKGWLNGDHPGWRTRLEASRDALAALAARPEAAPPAH